MTLATAKDESPPQLRGSAAKIGRLSAVYLAGNLLPRVLGVFLLPVFTAYLAPAQMGIVTIALRFAAPVTILMQCGLVAGLTWHFFRTPEPQRPSLLRTMLLAQTAHSALFAILLSLVGIWLAEALLPNLPLSTDYVYALWLLIVWTSFFSTFIDLGTSVARIREQAVLATSIRTLSYLSQIGLGLVAVVGLGWLGFGRQLTVTAGAAIGAILSIAFLLPLASGRFDFSLYRRTFYTGLTFVPHTLTGLLGSAINAWLLVKLASSASLAIFGVALVFAKLVDLPLESVVGASYPTMARLMTHATPTAMVQQSRLYTLQIVGLTALAVFAAILAPLAIHFLAASEYAEAQLVVPIVVASCLCRGLYLAVAQPVSYIGGGFWLSTASTSSTLLGIIVAVVLIPSYGAYGAAWSLFASRATGLVVAAVVGYRLYPLPWDVWKIFRLLACGGGIALADYCLTPHLHLSASIALKLILLVLLLPAFLCCRAVTRKEVLQATKMAADAIRHLRGNLRT